MRNRLPVLQIPRMKLTVRPVMMTRRLFILYSIVQKCPRLPIIPTRGLGLDVSTVIHTIPEPRHFYCMSN